MLPITGASLCPRLSLELKGLYLDSKGQSKEQHLIATCLHRLKHDRVTGHCLCRALSPSVFTKFKKRGESSIDMLQKSQSLRHCSVFQWPPVLTELTQRRKVTSHVVMGYTLAMTKMALPCPVQHEPWHKATNLPPPVSSLVCRGRHPGTEIAVQDKVTLTGWKALTYLR